MLKFGEPPVQLVLTERTCVMPDHAIPQERAPIAVFKEDDVAFVDQLVQQVTAWLQVGAGLSPAQDCRDVLAVRSPPELCKLLMPAVPAAGNRSEIRAACGELLPQTAAA